MTDDPDYSTLAGQIASAALLHTGDPLDALQVLVQAGSALAMTKLSPPAFALAAFDGAHAVGREKFVEVLSIGEVRQ